LISNNGLLVIGIIALIVAVLSGCGSLLCFICSSIRAKKRKTAHDSDNEAEMDEVKRKDDTQRVELQSLLRR
jgi:hypothetical protein